MEYDQYRPVLPYDMLQVTIHVALHSSLIVTSGFRNDGLYVNSEQAREKQWLTLQQPPFLHE
jgi:hypothetical protein